MAYTPIGSGEVETRKPVSATTLDKIRTNLDDHEVRINAAEIGTNTVYPPMLFTVNGPYGFYGIRDNIHKTTVNFDMKIMGVRLLINTSGPSGSTEIDLKVKRGGLYTSIFTVKPSVLFSAGDDAISSNGILSPNDADLVAGDLIRLDLTAVQLDARGFTVRIDYVRV